MANPTVVAGSQFSTGSAAAISANWSTKNAAADDILLWFINTANETIGANPPTGFTQIGVSTGIGTPATAGALKAYAFAKLYDGTEGSVSIGDSGDYQEQSGLVVRGARLSELYHKISVVEEPSATTSVSLPSVTTETNECLIIGYVASDEDTATARYTGWANSGLTSITEEVDHATSAGFGGGSAIVSGVQATAGAVGATTATREVASVMTYITVAFRPPATGSTVSPGEMASVSVMESPTVSAEGSVAPAEMASANVMESPAVTGVYTTPTVSRPAGGGDVLVASTVITDGTTATPTIELFGDPETNENVTGDKWQTFWCAVDLNETGRTPVFKLDFTDWRNSTPPANNALVWRASGGGVDDWAPFDNRSVAGSILTVSNNTPFAASAIEVALVPPWSYSEIQAWLSAVDSSAYVHRPALCTTLAISSSAPDKYAYHDFPDQTSPDGVAVGSVYAYAVRISDDSFTPPGGKIRLLWDWTHAGEWTGLRKLKEALDKLLTSADADWVFIRQHCDVIVALQNTAGLVGGMGRGVCEPGDVGEDPNREWWLSAASSAGLSDPISSIDSTINLIKDEWGTVDAGATVDCHGIVSWHSQRADSNFFCDYATNLVNAQSQYLHDRMVANYGLTIGNLGDVVGTGNTSSRFASDSTQGGLYATLEWGYNVADVLAETASVEAFKVALVETIEAGWFAVASPAEMASTNVMESPALTASSAVSPAEMASVSAMEPPTVAAQTSAAPAGMASLSVMEGPALTVVSTASPAGMVSSNAMEPPGLTVTSAATPAEMASVSIMGSPTVVGAGTALPSKMVSTSAMEAPSLSVQSAAQPVEMASASVMEAPSITVGGAITASKMVSLSEMGSPALSVLTSAQPGEMISLSTMETPAIGAGGSAMPSRMVSVSVMEAPALSTYGAVQPAEMASANVMGSPSFTSYGFVPPVPAGRTAYSVAASAAGSTSAVTVGHSVN